MEGAGRGQEGNHLSLSAAVECAALNKTCTKWDEKPGRRLVPARPETDRQGGTPCSCLGQEVLKKCTL